MNHEGKTEAALSMLAAVPADDAPVAIGTTGIYICEGEEVPIHYL